MTWWSLAAFFSSPDPPLNEMQEAARQDFPVLLR
jgi:hypothetical protein